MSDNLKERLTDMSVLASSRTPEDALKYIEELEAKLKTSEEIGRAFEEDAGQLRANLAEAVEALGEAIYLLDPDEEDIAKETGLHRIVTTYAELTGGKDE